MQEADAYCCHGRCRCSFFSMYETNENCSKTVLTNHSHSGTAPPLPLSVTFFVFTQLTGGFSGGCRHFSVLYGHADFTTVSLLVSVPIGPLLAGCHYGLFAQASASCALSQFSVNPRFQCHAVIIRCEHIQGGFFAGSGQRVAVSELVVRKMNIYPSGSFLRLLYLKIQLEVDFHPLF